jgi:hypothetical protein
LLTLKDESTHVEILTDAQCVEDVLTLRYVADPNPRKFLEGLIGNILPPEQHAPLSDANQAQQGSKQRALARSVRPNYREYPPARGGNTDAVDHGGATIAGDHPLTDEVPSGNGGMVIR